MVSRANRRLMKIMVRSFRVGRSSAGLGLFAVRPIRTREYIVTYSGKRIPTDEAQRRERQRKLKFMFEINLQWTVDGSSRRNLARYVNHSCRANAKAVLRKGQLVFVAECPIAPGEEITLDYGEEYFHLFLRQGGCRCAACEAKATRRRGRSNSVRTSSPASVKRRTRSTASR
jgi:uncharacterized protein